MFIQGGAEILVGLVVWVLFACVAAKVADSRGRSGAAWFLLSLLFSPLVTIIILALTPVDRDGIVRNGQMKKCPQCAEMIQAEAKICRYCRSSVTAPQPELVAR